MRESSERIEESEETQPVQNLEELRERILEEHELEALDEVARADKLDGQSFEVMNEPRALPQSSAVERDSGVDESVGHHDLPEPQEDTAHTKAHDSFDDQATTRTAREDLSELAPTDSAGAPSVIEDQNGQEKEPKEPNNEQTAKLPVEDRQTDSVAAAEVENLNRNENQTVVVAQEPSEEPPGRREQTGIKEGKERQEENERAQSVEQTGEPSREPNQNGPKAPEVENVSRNDNQVIVTEQEPSAGTPGKDPPDSVETSDLRRFPTRAEPEPHGDETRILEAVDYGKGAVVRVPKTDLEREGCEPEAGQTVRLGFRDVESEDVETVFARYNAPDRRAEAYVDDIGGKKGSQFELVEAQKVDEDRLVRDFERCKCEHLDNVRLEHTDDKMFVNVDNRRVELKDYRIATTGSHAIVKGKLDGDDSCRIEFEGRRASVKFGRDYQIEEMRMEGDDLVVKYAQSRNEKHEHRMYLEHHQTPELPSLNQFDKPEMQERVKMFDHPERIGGLYQFVMDKETQGEIMTLLQNAERRGENEYGMAKAEISETLVPNLLEVCGWKRVERHPFNVSDKDGAMANGSDWLMRAPDGKVVLTEIKWYENKQDAIRKATTQVERDFLQHRDDPDLKLEGAYIAIIDYDEENKDGAPIRVHVLLVRQREELR